LNNSESTKKLLWEEAHRVALPRVVVLKDEITDTVIANDENRMPGWELKRGRRSRKMDRIEKQWYRVWGLGKDCSICGENHSAMRIKSEDMGVITYTYECPVALRDHWPPQESDWGGLQIWNSLDISQEKLALLHGYNHKAIDDALFNWENHGAGLILSDADIQKFKEEVLKICDDERQSWTFKRTLEYGNSTEEEYDF